MASNHTQNYNLNQWQPTDPVIRTDFNEDNAKLEAALSSLEERVAILDRFVPKLTYYVGQLGLRDLVESQCYLDSRNMLYETFYSAEGLTFTGGVTLDNGVAVLYGAGHTGSIAAATYILDSANWSKALMWVQFSTGDITIKLNGEPMEYVTSRGVRVSSGNCWEREFVWDGPASKNVQITLDLNTKNASVMKVYNYCIFFL